MHFLIVVDSAPQTEPAVGLGRRLAAAASARVTVLAPANEFESEADRQAALERAVDGLPGAARISAPTRGAAAVLAEVEAGGYDLIVAPSRGRRGWQRLAFGSRGARLARYSPVPVLLVKGAARPAIRRVLACTSADTRSDRVARWAGRLAGWLGAQLTLMHVMSQMALSAEALPGPLEDTAEEAMAGQTREGQHLTRQMALAAAQGLPAERAPLARLRHGLVVDEVVAEARQGDYDLVVIGGHQAPPASEGLSQLKAYLLDDVADQIIMALQRPMLIVKGE